MLYVSTRNTIDTFTAHHALHEAFAPDGGTYVPFHLPEFTGAELLKMREKPCGDVIAEILNLFFGTHLIGWNVESAIGRTPFKIEFLSQRLIIAEVWRNPDGSSKYLVDTLYRLACGENYTGMQPTGWALIAIQIALLFGIYAATDVSLVEKLDIALPAGDFSDIVAVLYSKTMGLPIGYTICACSESSAVWDFICRGELSTNVNLPVYFESYVYKTFGADEVQRYLDACAQKRVFFANEAQQLQVTTDLTASVVSTQRIDTVIAGMYQSNQYNMDHNAALSFSALQDYRARNGSNKTTLILAKKRSY